MTLIPIMLGKPQPGRPTACTASWPFPLAQDGRTGGSLAVSPAHRTFEREGGVMGADWQIGDLALCVNGGSPRYIDEFDCWENSAEYELQQGRIYTVDRVDLEFGITGLHFAGLDWAWLASRFVKVTPPEADEFDRETIRLLTSAPETVEAL